MKLAALLALLALVTLFNGASGGLGNWLSFLLLRFGGYCC
jgi:hypothetical protein